MKSLCFALLGLCVTVTSFSQKGQSSVSFDKSIISLKKADNAEDYIYAFLDEYLKNPTEEHMVLFDRFEKTLWRSLITSRENLAYTILLCNKGYYLSRFGNIYQSIDAYEKAWIIYSTRKLDGFDIIEYCLQPLGNNYTILGDYTSATNIVKNYLYRAEQAKNESHILSALINLSIIYHSTGKYNDAIAVLQHALSLKTILPDKKALLYSNLATNYTSLNDLRNAKHYAALSLILLKRNGDTETASHIVNVYSLLSSICIRENNIEDALDFITKAQRIAFSRPKEFKNRDLAKLLNNMASLMSLRQDYSGAVNKYYKSLAILIPGYKGYDLPDTSALYAENTIKETLDGLAQVYVKIDKPEIALHCYDLSYRTEDLLRETYNYDEARLLQQIENRNRTESAIDILYTRLNKTKNQQDIARAFLLAERTKAITLKENIEYRYSYRSIDNNLLKQEADLRYKQATLANDIIVEQMRQRQADISRIHNLIDQQTNIALKIKAVKKKLVEKYPEYKKSAKLLKTIDWRILQKQLEDDNAILIEYFAGRGAFYAFMVDAQSITLKKIDSVQRLKKDIIELYDLLSNPSAINNTIERYKTLALRLSVTLNLTRLPIAQNLIVIPDGLLNMIPFDALLYDTTAGNQYATFHYLLKKYSIAYQPSAELYMNSTREIPSANQENRILAMFPVFENTNQELEYSAKEANSIHKYMKGEYLYNRQATRKSFLESANQFNIIHLSTHASSGTATEPPSITFIDSTLYLPQVYGMNLDADLMVLSACETGAGVLVKGEGAMSLARGFQFAGVRNIIFSLWRVNDYSTASLMANFYAAYLTTGMKAASLHQSKLDYLADDEVSNSHKSPYYWAGFVYYGSIHKYEFDHKVDYYWVVGVSILSIILILYIKRRRIPKNNT